MSLAGELAGAGSPPEQLDVEATVTLDEVEDGSHRIVASDILARARVTSVDAETLQRLAQRRERRLSVLEADRGERDRDGERNLGGRDEWRLIAPRR